MIKKYNQFVESKVNEEFEMAEPMVKPSQPEVAPGTTERPSERPGSPSPIRRERTSPIPAPAKAELEEEEEEGGQYIGKKMMSDLSNQLGVDIDEDGSINYNGKKINFYSETEKFHVDRKKFDTVEDVVNYVSESDKITPEEEEFGDRKTNSGSSINPEGDEYFDDEEEFGDRKTNSGSSINPEGDEYFDDEDEKFESKSYRHTRLKKFGK